jgi:cyclophilin family peptidyl-prolyl cis-trans isomerase
MLRLKTVFFGTLFSCFLLISCEQSGQNQRASDPLPEDTPPPIEQPAEQQPTETANQDTAVVTHVVTMNTSLGTIKLGLFGKDAPNTVENFIELCKKNYYDGVVFHRVISGFMVQAGDPQSRDVALKDRWGTGGVTWNEKPLIDELNPEAPSFKTGYPKGTLAMGNTGQPNTSRSQFFIMTGSTVDLPRQYPIFGKVIGGMDVVEKIEATEIDSSPQWEGRSMPKNPPVIKSTKVEAVQ